jgi:hypothetical protein
MISPQSIMVRASSFVLQGGGFNNDASTYTLNLHLTPYNLKNLSCKAHVYLTFLIKGCLKLSYFPTKWKHAIVIPIQKPNKDLSNPSNFRPISLFSSVSKLFERIILRRFNEFLRDHYLLSNHQFGWLGAWCRFAAQIDTCILQRS